jgi:hypothetical protein
MAYYAKIQATANSAVFIVTEVIVADRDFIYSGAVGSPEAWVQTSYNTYGNVHYAPSPPAEPNTPDGGVPLRANYAVINGIYNKFADVFYAPQPYPSWLLNEDTWLWYAPVAVPTEGGPYNWDEKTRSWVDLTKQG